MLNKTEHNNVVVVTNPEAVQGTFNMFERHIPTHDEYQMLVDFVASHKGWTIDVDEKKATRAFGKGGRLYAHTGVKGAPNYIAIYAGDVNQGDFGIRYNKLAQKQLSVVKACNIAIGTIVVGWNDSNEIRKSVTSLADAVRHLNNMYAYIREYNADIQATNKEVVLDA